MKKFLFDFFKRFKTGRRLARRVLLVIRRTRFNLLNLGNSVEEKTVLFEVFSGRTFADSPKALYLEMLSDPKYKDYKKIWVFQEPEEKKHFFDDPNTILVRRKTKAYYRAYGRAKYWVVNFREPNELKKKRNQVYVQCWHGTPLKKLGHDIVAEGAALNSTKEIYYNYDKDTKRIDLMVSPSAYTTKKLSSAFNLKAFNKEDIIIEKGYPRNDALFNYSEDYVAQLKEHFGLPDDKKVILYAPTFRDDQHKSGVGYSYKIELDFDRLRNDIGDEYVVLFRAHYFVLDSIDLSKYEGFIFDASNHDDPNDLYIISDMLITDYSSVFFDYANLKRPILFYMYDKEAYQKNLRDFYIDFDTLPGPIVETEDDLIKSILNTGENSNLGEMSQLGEYEKAYKDFNKKYNYLEDGNASYRVLGTIMSGVKYEVSLWKYVRRIIRNKIKATITRINKVIPGFRSFTKRRNANIKRSKYKRYMSEYKVDDKLIIFDAYMGQAYACSPKAIYEKLKQDNRFDNYRMIWAIKDRVDRRQIVEQDPQFMDVETVRYGSDDYYKLCAQAKYLITNSRLTDYFIKRDEQVYVQCWHGTPLKRLAHDINVHGDNALNTMKNLKETYDRDSARYTYMLSASAYMSEKLSSAFNLAEVNPSVEIIEKGYPRNDFLFSYTDSDAKRIRQCLQIEASDNRKLILYAPTWRDNQHRPGVGYSLQLGFDFDKLKRELENDFIILFKPHYFIANEFDFDKYEGFVYDATQIRDINNLYIIADIMITDYSSVMFDYANLKRPMIFYMYDLEEYGDVIRGFYFDINELPGEIIKEEDQLIEEIKAQGRRIDDGSWKNIDEKYEAFNAKFNYLDDGNASDRVIEEVMV